MRAPRSQRLAMPSVLMMRTHALDEPQPGTSACL